MTVKITFLGAAGSVTGSKYLIESDNTKILVDAGMFQGKRDLRERNWKTPDVDLKKIDAVILTHAHIDHTGILPRYHALGLDCPVYVTSATSELVKLLLLDSGRLHEEEASYRNKKGKSRHKPALPLFTESDSKETIKLLKSVNFNEEIKILDNVSATWTRMGHIIGAASVNLKIGGKTITFSGDIGRYNIPILVDPKPVEFGDVLLIESTYGDRLHKDHSPKESLGKIISKTYKRGGTIIIPSFAVGRAQLLLYYIRELKEEGLIPDIPVIIDSPMAKDATNIYSRHPEDYDEAALGILKKGNKPFEMSKLALIKDRDASIRLNRIKDPMIIISASGMLYGGRILHHVKNRISDKKNTIVFVGYQPGGSKGEKLKSGAKTINILGSKVEVKAEIESINGLSAHGDRDEMLKWCESSSGTPNKVYIVHGEGKPAESFSKTLKEKFSWDTSVAKYLESIEI